ncbi:hypothetical protein [Amphritea balenae]|uniref:Uncharacterized protein n=1 Tax=Amphritea balenae TaxID=452629 RepID=A0A3P1SLK6_9GAMM|nr:hypothetical protein [Amphritea balenae]RRC98018.1 hypothetical protein EHS89_15700 [Amphritea balenae]GGK66823.1 hypothetical protein GCM10007941_16180 [Amphritea balenae]
MAYNNKTIQRLHNDLFTLIGWLELLEEEQQVSCYQHLKVQPTPVRMSAILAGLETSLEQMAYSFMLEEEQLFELLKQSSKRSIIANLKPRRRVISTLIYQLLNSIKALRLSLQSPATKSVIDSPQSHGEDYWDDALRLAPSLNNRLIRYLQAAESSYLPEIDYLLDPSDDLEFSSDLSITAMELGQAIIPSNYYH